MWIRFNAKMGRHRYLTITSTLLGLLTVTGLLTGCESLIRDVDPSRIPTEEPQLVVHCYLSPQDTLLVASVSASRTAVGKQVATGNANAVLNALVTLSEGNRSITLSYNAVLGVYQADAKQFPIMTGRTYQFDAATPDGKRVSATTTIPDAVPISTVEFDSAAAQFGSGQEYFIQFSWQDPTSTNNYYHTTGDTDYEYVSRVYSNATTYKEVTYQYVDQIYFNNTGSSSPYLIDETLNGRVMSSPKGRLYNLRSGNSPKYVNVYLLSTTEAYYRYHQTVWQQRENGDNPFAEPTLILSNVQGGFGCFGGYNRTVKTVRVR